MITGIINAIGPINPNLESTSLYALVGLNFVFLPIAISVVIRVKPNVSASIMYTRINIPPPYCAARYGNLHRLPSPTALPAAASTNPISPVKLPLFFFSISYSKPFLINHLMFNIQYLIIHIINIFSIFKFRKHIISSACLSDFFNNSMS